MGKTAFRPDAGGRRNHRHATTSAHQHLAVRTAEDVGPHPRPPLAAKLVTPLPEAAATASMDLHPREPSSRSYTVDAVAREEEDNASSSSASTTRNCLSAARRPAARGSAGSSLEISATRRVEPCATSSRARSRDPSPPAQHGLCPAADADRGGGGSEEEGGWG